MKRYLGENYAMKVVQKRSLIKRAFGRTCQIFLEWQCRIKFNGKPFTPAIQSAIKETFKSRRDIYLHDEATARSLADNWQGTESKPPNLRFIQNAIPIVLSANEDFAPYMAVMLQSLMDNSNQERKYHFIIFERNFSKKTKKYLMDQMLKFSHCTIDFINTEGVLDGIPIAPAPGSHLSVDAFSRLFIPYWLDKYPKVIYCDSDMIARADIAELYDLDIQDFCMGAVECQTTHENIESRMYSYLLKWSAVYMLLDNWLRYLNSGVLVFDTQKFKEKISYRDCFKLAIYYTNRYRKRFNDQDVIALLFKDDYFSLSPEWNYTLSIAGKGKSYCHATKLNAKIFHFITSIKPWKNIPSITNNFMVLEYRNYAKNVPLFRERGIK